MHVIAANRRVEVKFGADDAPELKERIVTALGYCCSESQRPVTIEGGVAADIAKNASSDGALALIELATQEVPKDSPTFVEEVRDIIMSDGLPFVVNR